jgi:hypothetical protein
MLNEIMLNKLIYHFKVLNYNCLPKILAFSDEFLKLNREENIALEKVINHLIKKELLYRKDSDLCLSEKGKKWISSLAAKKDIKEKAYEENKKIPPYDLLRILIAFYKLKKENQEKAIKELVNKVNDFESIDEILKEFETIIKKL